MLTVDVGISTSLSTSTSLSNWFRHCNVTFVPITPSILYLGYIRLRQYPVSLLSYTLVFNQYPVSPYLVSQYSIRPVVSGFSVSNIRFRFVQIISGSSRSCISYLSSIHFSQYPILYLRAFGPASIWFSYIRYPRVLACSSASIGSLLSQVQYQYLVQPISSSTSIRFRSSQYLFQYPVPILGSEFV